jgi:hypothetical protein
MHVQRESESVRMNLLAPADKYDGSEPYTQGQMRVLEDRSASYRKLSSTCETLIKMTWLSGLATRRDSRNLLSSTLDTLHTVRPPQSFQIFETRFFTRKFFRDVQNASHCIHHSEKSEMDPPVTRVVLAKFELGGSQ